MTDVGGQTIALVEMHPLGVVLRAPMQVDLFLSTCKHFKASGYGFIATNLCGRFKSVAVLTKSAEDAEAWADQLRSAAKTAYPNDRELEWIYGVDTGTSSLAIFSVLSSHGHLAQLKRDQLGDPPRDPSDFGRCHRLLEHIPEWRPRLAEVAERFPIWRGLVENWSELERIYLRDFESGRSDELYQRMQKLIDRTRKP